MLKNNNKKIIKLSMKQKMNKKIKIKSKLCNNKMNNLGCPLQ